MKYVIIIILIIIQLWLLTLIESQINLNECNKKLYSNYDLELKPIPEFVNNNICKNVYYSCCTDNDFKVILRQFNTDYKHNIENYYSLFNYYIKYIFYSLYSYNNLITYKEDKINPKYFNNNSHISNKELEEIKLILNKYTVNISNIRTNSVCYICDFYSYVKLFDLEKKYEIKNNNEILISDNFCKLLVQNTIEANFLIYNKLLDFIIITNKLLSKILDIDNKFNLIDVSWEKSYIANCYYNYNNDLLFYCEDYCNNFKLDKLNKVLDGNLELLKNIYDYYKYINYNYIINVNKNIFFNNNLLKDIDNKILNLEKSIPKITYILKPNNTTTTNNNFNTIDFYKIIYNKYGYNLEDLKENKYFELSLKNIKLIVTSFVILFLYN